MEPVHSLIIGCALFLSGAVGSLLLFPRAPLIGRSLYLLSVAGCLSFAVPGFAVLGGQTFMAGPVALSSLFSFAFRADPLSGFFVLLVAVVGAAVSLYSLGYTKGIKTPALMGFLYPLFVLSMFAVLLAGNAVTFLISWETMSLLSYFLVTFSADEKSARAGLLYAVMTHLGTAFIMALFLILYKQTGSMDFAALKALAPRLPAEVKSLLFLFALIGFGVKAGMAPLHVWLPKAHPAAPSNISALMSAVMIKTGIYGFLRIVFDLLGQGPEWWGLAVLAVGAVSAIAGALYALVDSNLKRFLAYSSVENIGIMLLGLGAALLFRSHGMNALAAVALTAGLYHTLNHALFKGLLFMTAGSVVHATGSKSMEELGGLAKAMPFTGALFLVGAVSICALPPFNGFASEWLTYQSLLLGFKAPAVLSKIVSPLGGAALALTGALAAAGFVKAFGISFLGMPRSAASRQAREVAPSMAAAPALLAALCLITGVLPGLTIELLGPVTAQLAGAAMQPSYAGVLSIEATTATLSPPGLVVTLLVMAAATALFVRIVGGKRKVSSGSSWDCGIRALTPRMQYTAAAFSKPLRVIFKRLYLPRRELKVSYLVKPFFVTSIRYRGLITPFFDRYVYEPLTGVVRSIAARVQAVQSGSLQLYLGYILITLILLLLFGT